MLIKWLYEMHGATTKIIHKFTSELFQYATNYLVKNQLNFKHAYVINLSKPIGHVMHQQFNTQQL